MLTSTVVCGLTASILIGRALTQGPSENKAPPTEAAPAAEQSAQDSPACTEEETKKGAIVQPAATELPRECRDYLQAAFRADGIQTIEVRQSGPEWSNRVATKIAEIFAQCGVRKRPAGNADGRADLVLTCDSTGTVTLRDPRRNLEWFTKEFNPPSSAAPAEFNKLAVRFMKGVLRGTAMHVVSPFEYTILVHNVRSGPEREVLESTVKDGELRTFGGAAEGKRPSAEFAVRLPQRDAKITAYLREWNKSLAGSGLTTRLIRQAGFTAEIVLSRKRDRPGWVAVTDAKDPEFASKKTKRTDHWKRDEGRNGLVVYHDPTISAGLVAELLRLLAECGFEVVPEGSTKDVAFEVSLARGSTTDEIVAQLKSRRPTTTLVGTTVWSPELSGAMDEEWNPMLHGDGDLGPARFICGDLVSQLDNRIAGAPVIREMYARIGNVSNFDELNRLLDRLQGKVEGVQQISLDGDAKTGSCWIRYVGEPQDLVKVLNTAFDGAAKVTAVGSGTMTIKFEPRV